MNQHGYLVKAYVLRNERGVPQTEELFPRRRGRRRGKETKNEDAEDGRRDRKGSGRRGSPHALGFSGAPVWCLRRLSIERIRASGLASAAESPSLRIRVTRSCLSVYRAPERAIHFLSEELIRCSLLQRRVSGFKWRDFFDNYIAWWRFYETADLFTHREGDTHPLSLYFRNKNSFQFFLTSV